MANVQYVDIVFHSVRKYEEQENNSCPWGDGHVNRHLNQATNIAKENKGYFFNDLGVRKAFLVMTQNSEATK